jgi:hypothetical protein
MSRAPLKIDDETRVYVRVALRDTLEAYDLADLLDVMADICQNNADVSRSTPRLGLTDAAWQLRADILRQAAERLEGLTGNESAPDPSVEGEATGG